MKRVALIPGSFDPFTRGHQSLVEQALRLFDHVVVAIGHNMNKEGLLDVEMRKRLIEELYQDEPRVEALIYEGLTGDFAMEVGAQAMIRGVRTSVDFEYERNLDAINRRLFPEIATLILVTPAELSHVSSSVVQELLAYGRDVTELMPEGVNLDKYLI